jgi:hypothetical protein
MGPREVAYLMRRCVLIRRHSKRKAKKNPRKKDLHAHGNGQHSVSPLERFERASEFEHSYGTTGDGRSVTYRGDGRVQLLLATVAFSADCFQKGYVIFFK